MSATGQTSSRPPTSLGLVKWLKKNLFSTWYNTLLTIVSALVIYVAVKGILTWVLTVADWSPVAESLKLFATGLYPVEQVWRIGTILAVVSFLAGLSWGVWGGTVRTFAIGIAAGFAVIAFLPFDLHPPNGDPLDLLLRAGFLALPVLIVVGRLIGPTRFITGRLVLILWLVSFVLTMILLTGFEDSTSAWLLKIEWAGQLLALPAELGLWGQLLLTFLLVIVGIVASLLIAAALALVLFLVGRLFGARRFVTRRLVLVLWLISFIVTTSYLLTELAGITLLPTLVPKVSSGLWGGLLLTFLLAIVGIVASFPIGVGLALGRQSSLPVLKAFCVLFIEMVRGVPLVTILFMASIILPLFLPEDIRIDRVLRAMIGMTLFAAAYMAENVRGGLQAIPRGQYEAAKAVGLTGFQTTTFIILPQALRAVIPAIVGQFIALFMDTTLAIIVGLLELLAIGRAVLQSNQEWLLLDKEVYLFIAVMFWIFTYSMSYASRRLEVALGLGER